MDNKKNDGQLEEGIASQQPHGISTIEADAGDPTMGSGDRGPASGSGDRDPLMGSGDR